MKFNFIGIHMNYKKILICFLFIINKNNYSIPPFKAAKRVSDIAGLTVLLRRHGYDVLSSTSEKFNALKQYPKKTISEHGSPAIIERVDSCKITQLEEDDFFVEISITESKELLGDYQKENIFQEGGFELKEESCKVHKETAYVFTLERAIEIVASFYNR